MGVERSSTGLVMIHWLVGTSRAGYSFDKTNIQRNACGGAGSISMTVARPQLRFKRRLDIGHFVLIGLVWASLTVSTQMAHAIAPPVEAYAQLPRFQTLKLSPDGTRIAALETVQGRRTLVVMTIRSNGTLARRELDQQAERFRPGDPFDLFWANNNRMVVRFKRATFRDDLPIRETRMVAMNADFSNQKSIPDLSTNRRATKTNRDTEETYEPPQYQDAVLHVLPNESNHILVQLRRFGQLTQAAKGYGFVGGSRPEHSVYKVNVNTGSISRVATGRWDVRGYLTDATGDIRIKTTLDAKTGLIETRQNEGRSWTKLLSFERSEGAAWTPLAFTDNPNRLLVMTRSSDGLKRVHAYNLRRRALGARVFANPQFDMRSLVMDRAGHVLGAEYIHHHPEVSYTRGPYASLQQELNVRWPNHKNYIRSVDASQTRFIIYSTNSRDPGFYSLLERDGKQSAEQGSNNSVIPIGRHYPGLAPEGLRPMQPITFPARDGLEIPGYLTLPEGSGPHPFIIMPHGGPNVRDTQSFQFDVQFLASRGYGVLQPNFRGSSGYGAAFEKAGHGEWGLKMQDDLTDSAHAMVSQGFADPQRLCIVGWSYGGYAALMGAIRTPDLFKCAIAGAPITDLERLMAERGRYLFESNNDPRVGNRWQDKGRIRDTSPINNVDAIKVPVLLIHGADDRVVSVGHSEAMARALAEAGRPHRYLRLEGGDHFRSRAEHRQIYLESMAQFLEQNIGEAVKP